MDDQAITFGGIGCWAYYSTKESLTQSRLFAYAERKRWREAPLWGENRSEQYVDYFHKEKVPGRVPSLLFEESPHYEPTNLVVNRAEYQPLDRWRNDVTKPTHY